MDNLMEMFEGRMEEFWETLRHFDGGGASIEDYVNLLRLLRDIRGTYEEFGTPEETLAEIRDALSCLEGVKKRAAERSGEEAREMWKHIEEAEEALSEYRKFLESVKEVEVGICEVVRDGFPFPQKNAN